MTTRYVGNNMVRIFLISESGHSRGPLVSLLPLRLDDVDDEEDDDDDNDSHNFLGSRKNVHDVLYYDGQ